MTAARRREAARGKRPTTLTRNGVPVVASQRVIHYRSAGKQPRSRVAHKQPKASTSGGRRRRSGGGGGGGGGGDSSDGSGDRSSSGGSDRSGGSNRRNRGRRTGRRMTQDELRRQLDLEAERHAQEAAGRDIAGITTTNTITTTFKDGGRPRVTRHSTSVRT